jgi:hypothetical protein
VSRKNLKVDIEWKGAESIYNYLYSFFYDIVFIFVNNQAVNQKAIQKEKTKQQNKKKKNKKSRKEKAPAHYLKQGNQSAFYLFKFSTVLLLTGGLDFATIKAGVNNSK